MYNFDQNSFWTMKKEIKIWIINLIALIKILSYISLHYQNYFSQIIINKPSVINWILPDISIATVINKEHISWNKIADLS